MTAQDAQKTEPASFQDSVFFYRLFCVLGARRVKNTTWFKKNRNMFLIKIN
jgi:hypothetical protein